VDQEDRGIGAIAERLRAQLDPVGLDDVIT
jgi:hypothetical protein